VIDDNCHPFAVTAEPLDLALMTVDVRADADGDRRRHAQGPWRVSQEIMVGLLCERLGCSREDLAAARAAAAADWPGYARRLFADAGLEQLVMDVGYPHGAELLISNYAEVSGCQILPVLRFETEIDLAIADGLSTEEIWERLSRQMTAAAVAGCVAFKAFIAYRTGLAVTADVAVRDADASLVSPEPVRKRGKMSRDLLLRRALGLAAELGRPVHVHAGIGDSDLRMVDANPLLLEPLLDTPEGRAARIVIIHGAYPFHEQLAYLATTRPNVWADVSMSNLYSPAAFADRLLRVLDLLPAGKLLLGTDGHDQPEVFWYGVRVLRRGWDLATRRLAGAAAPRGHLSRTEQRIFGGNARDLYGLAG
jgi:hypothetical protein